MCLSTTWGLFECFQGWWHVKAFVVRQSVRPIIEINDSIPAGAYWNTNFTKISTHVSTEISIKTLVELWQTVVFTVER